MNKYNVNDLMLQFADNGLIVSIFWSGGNYCSYIFEKNGVELDRSDDFKPSSMHNIDDIESMISLIGFLTIRPGDTDEDYFRNHSKEFMQWLQADDYECENLRLKLYDLEIEENPNDPDSIGLQKDARKYFKKHTKQYPVRQKSKLVN